jgi:hypothetical protein
MFAVRVGVFCATSTLYGDIAGEDLDISMPKMSRYVLPSSWRIPAWDAGGLDLRSKSFWVPGTISKSEG